MENRKQKFLEFMERASNWVEPENQGVYDADNRVVHMSMRAYGTADEGRPERIECLHVGDTVRLVREKDHPRDRHRIHMRTFRGESLGLVSAMWAELLAPLLDSGKATLSMGRVTHVAPRSRSGRHLRAAELQVEFDINFPVPTGKGCTVCLLGGDQTKVWSQKLEVAQLDMPASAAALLFEIYNRMHDEYESGREDTAYAGLDNLAEEITAARAKMRAGRIPGLSYAAIAYNEDKEGFVDVVGRMIAQEPARYGVLRQYMPAPEDPVFAMDFRMVTDEFRDMLLCQADDVKTYCWNNQTRVGSDEYGGDFYHWYDIAELFEEGVPVDLDDEDVVSMMGTGKFAAFADLSYGC